MPTKENITDCIRYGDFKNSDIDVEEALDSAVKQQMVIKQNVGMVSLYIGKNEKLWHCVNTSEENPNVYAVAIWDKVQNYLESPIGQSAIRASKCRYEAATHMKKFLNDLSLGNVIHILYLATIAKMWITHSTSEWQPLRITLPVTRPDLGSVPGA